jgi:hypothetical protein
MTKRPLLEPVEVELETNSLLNTLLQVAPPRFVRVMGNADFRRALTVALAVLKSVPSKHCFRRSKPEYESQHQRV